MVDEVVDCLWGNAEAYHWRRTWCGAPIFQIGCSALDRCVGSNLTMNVPGTKRGAIVTDKLESYQEIHWS